MWVIIASAAFAMKKKNQSITSSFNVPLHGHYGACGVVFGTSSALSLVMVNLSFLIGVGWWAQAEWPQSPMSVEDFLRDPKCWCRPKTEKVVIVTEEWEGFTRVFQGDPTSVELMAIKEALVSFSSTSLDEALNLKRELILVNREKSTCADRWVDGKSDFFYC
ncbi:hypothetical protein V6N11_053523 [Hibiscus sabdariffa]|uniref:Uncharacterized protein n=1 Tax=Hibiscus sabdariffa TaxID=183260 RepID=A0ABR2UDA3_9ROSI